MADMLSKIDELTGKPCYLIDMFPCTVPETPDRRYFAIEELFQNDRTELDKKFCKLLLKLYCYYDFWVSAGEETAKNPEPGQFIKWACRCFQGAWRKRGHIHIILPECDAMLLLNGDDLYMSLYNPDERLMKLMSQLAEAEGLFFYKAPETPAQAGCFPPCIPQ